MNIIRKHYGTIELGSSVVLSDPCYEPGIWCASELHTMQPGTYDCYADFTYNKDWGIRVARLVIMPADEPPHGYVYDDSVNGCLAVDAGVFGIFDRRYFIEKKTTDEERWYNDNVISWAAKEHAFICEDGKGFITSSGYGDGAYNAYYSKNQKGQINSIEVIFIEPNDEDIDDFNIYNEVSSEEEITKEMFFTEEELKEMNKPPRIDIIRKTLMGRLISHYNGFSGSHIFFTIGYIKSEGKTILVKPDRGSNTKIYIPKEIIKDLINKGLVEIKREIESCPFVDSWKIL